MLQGNPQTRFEGSSAAAPVIFHLEASVWHDGLWLLIEVKSNPMSNTCSAGVHCCKCDHFVYHFATAKLGKFHEGQEHGGESGMEIGSGWISTGRGWQHQCELYHYTFFRPDQSAWINSDICQQYCWLWSDLAHCSCWGVTWAKWANVPLSWEDQNSPMGYSITSTIVSPHWNFVRIGLYPHVRVRVFCFRAQSYTGVVPALRSCADPVLSQTCCQMQTRNSHQWVVHWTGISNRAGAQMMLRPSAVPVTHWSSTGGTQSALMVNLISILIRVSVLRIYLPCWRNKGDCFYHWPFTLSSPIHQIARTLILNGRRIRTFCFHSAKI